LFLQQIRLLIIPYRFHAGNIIKRRIDGNKRYFRVFPMDRELAFLDEIESDPLDGGLRLVLADWLEGKGDFRGELLRLVHLLTQSLEVAEREKREDRLRNLLLSGIKPVGPYRTNSLGMTFALIPAGIFLMGSSQKELSHNEDETSHPVLIRKPFWMGIYTVTQAQWKEVMGQNPSHFQGADLPVEHVTWEECEGFCQRLEEKEGFPYRLPAEKEWEYACRAGTTTPFYFGASLTSELAHFDGQHPYGCTRSGKKAGKTSSNGLFPPNGFGLYDMHGNVWEWCSDTYGERYDGIRLPSPEEHDPRQYDPRDIDQKGRYRVFRGGAWNSNGASCRSAFRNYAGPHYRSNAIGLRLVFDADIPG